MDDWDWIGSCIPYTVRSAGSTVTTSSGGSMGEVDVAESDFTPAGYVVRPAAARKRSEAGHDAEIAAQHGVRGDGRVDPEARREVGGRSTSGGGDDRAPRARAPGDPSEVGEGVVAEPGALGPSDVDPHLRP